MFSNIAALQRLYVTVFFFVLVKLNPEGSIGEKCPKLSEELCYNITLDGNFFRYDAPYNTPTFNCHVQNLE